MTDDNTRSIHCDITFQAEPRQVWQALTQAQHIRAWFAPDAEAEPGVGGYIKLRWDRTAEEHQNCQIVEWLPERRLLMSWRDAPEGEHPLPVSIELERREDGGTLLRLVHSGFLSDASWDDEFDSHARGWHYELRSLKVYLESFFGRQRHYVLTRIPLDPTRDWSRVVGTQGLFRVASEAAEAAEVWLGLPTGERTRARVVSALTDKDFAATLDVLKGGIFRLAFETFAGGPEVWVWTFSYQQSEAELLALAQPWFDALRTLLSEEPARDHSAEV